MRCGFVGGKIRQMPQSLCMLLYKLSARCVPWLKTNIFIRSIQYRSLPDSQRPKFIFPHNLEESFYYLLTPFSVARVSHDDEAKLNRESAP